MRFIFIKSLVLLAALSSVFAASAQNVRTITGKVTGSDGVVLGGATVLVSPGGKYAIADNSGNYSVPAAKGSTLTVSFMGYDDATVTVGDARSYNFVLNVSDATALKELVKIGYGKTTKKELTGSVVSLKSENFDRGSFSSPAEMLQGKVAGLVVANPDGGDPNASFEILLRGANTLTSGQGPLIIIDGVVGADMRNINFQEVESFDVLKDGSAAAIYGTRGTNGVVIITTKRAHSGRAVVEYDGQVSVQTVAARAMPMNASQFASTIMNYAPAMVSSIKDADTDWFKEITRTPFSHKHSIAVSGGSDKFSHRTVINIEQNQGLQKKNDSQKYLVKTNIHQSAIEGWLDLDYNLSYIRRDYSPADYGAFRQAFMRNPTEPVYDSEKVKYGGYYTLEEMDYVNPVAMINEKDVRNTSNAFNGNVRATLNILPVKGLKWDNFFSYSGEEFEERNYRTHYYPSSVGKNGVAYIGNSESTDMQWESTLQYANVFGKHSLQALLGYTWQQLDSHESSMENYGFDNDAFKTDNISAGSALQEGKGEMNSYRDRSRYIAFFGRVMYNYDERYLISASLRRDGSSRFGSANKWGWFPAVSVGWRLNKEKWLRNAGWLSELKLRAGYGVTGNQDFANYKSLQLMAPKNKFYYNGQWINAYAPVSNSNPDLGWERKNEVNVGLDFAFFGGRLGGVIDFYHRQTNDLLYDYTVPVPPYDYGTMFTNVGSISNTGIEVTIYGTPVKTKKVEWMSTLTFAHNKNKLISFKNEQFQGAEYKIGWLSTPVDAYCQRLVEGESLGSFYAPVYLRTDPVTGKDVLEDCIAGRVSDSAYKNVGTAYPDVTIGWSNSVNIGNLSLSMTLRAAVGGKVLNQYRAEYENITQIGLRNIMASWLNNTAYTAPNQYSSKYIEDASYLKLDNLSVSYLFKLKNKYLHDIRVSLTGQNLFCLTGYSGVDPEVGLTGLTPGIEGTSYYPRVRTFTLGLNLAF